MSIVTAIACAALGVLVTPYLTSLVQRVPNREPVPLTLRPARYAAGGAAGRTDAERRRDAALRVIIPVTLALAGARFGFDATLLPFLVLFSMLVVVSAVDIEHYRIPNRVLYPSLGISAALIAVISLARGEPEMIGNAALGAVVFYGLLLLPHLIYPAGMGYGDVKLGLVMGLHLGWLQTERLGVVSLVLMALVFGSALGTVGGLTVALVRKRRDAFPFGPALAVGCIIAVLFSESIVRV